MCMISRGSTKKIVTILLLLLLCLLPAWQGHGYAMTTVETNQCITIPIQQWQTLKAELITLNSELLQCRADLSRLNKPSTELVKELAQADSMLTKLQQDLEQQQNDLTVLSKEVGEYKTLLSKLKTQIDKERRTHKRQVWQNRVWCLLIGMGIGCAIH